MPSTNPICLPPALAALVARRPIRLGTRQSPLAMAQARMTAAALRDRWGLAENQIELCPVVASGDKVLDRALREVGGKALWTRELDRSLLDGDIDAAVHSMKDVETIRDPRFAIGAMLPRADVRDVLLGAESLEAIPQGARLGTSSPRRAAQMRRLRPDITVVLFRGNVATRMQKLHDGVADVTLLAGAGLDRLGETLEGLASARLSEDDWLPAPAQGAVGIEALADNAVMAEALAEIDDAPTSRCVRAERALLAALGGDCHTPIAALARDRGAMIHLRAMLFSEDGVQSVVGEAEVAPGDNAGPAALAHDLLSGAPASIRALFNPA